MPKNTFKMEPGRVVHPVKSTTLKRPTHISCSNCQRIAVKRICCSLYKFVYTYYIIGLDGIMVLKKIKGSYKIYKNLITEISDQPPQQS